MRLKTICSGLPVILLFISSCVQEIDVDSKRDNKIVLNALLVGDQTEQTLTLTQNNGLGNFIYDEVKDPIITLYCDDFPIGNYTRIAYSKWKIEHKPSAGKKYRITVSANGFSEISAETIMPEEPQIKTPVFIATTFNPESYRHSIPFEYSAPLNSMWIFNLTYRFTYGEEFNPAFPFDSGYKGPLPGDIYLTDIQTDLPNADYYTDKYIRIPSTYVGYSTPFRLTGDYLSQAIFFFRNASYEYDAYLKSSIKKALLFNEEYDISRWFDESAVYSNVKNGLGIFAAYNDYIFVTNLPDEVIE